MALVIQDRRVRIDPWLRLEPDAGGGFPALPGIGDVIVPLALWRAQRAGLVCRPSRIGVWLSGDDDPSEIAEDLKLFGVVAVHFPSLNDGRGYSTGRLLRERYGWKGELRAIGDIFRDQLFFLASCGFNAFVLREGENLREALAAFDVFSESYQTSVERPVPLFRRRPAAAPGDATS